ncbi:hypothetical protein LguiB_019342 [Lonicera macranthoides]
MLSTFLPLPSSDFTGIPFPLFEGGFIPWDYYDEPPFVSQQEDPIIGTPPKQTQNPVLFNTGSKNSTSNHTGSNSGLVPTQTQKSVLFNSGSDNSNSNHAGSNSGSDEPNRSGSVTDERKRRRMISNRESARRSRMRKQKHLENLRNQLNRLKIGNRELLNQLRLVTHNCRILRGDNDRLLSESVMLTQKLWDIRQILLVRQIQQQLSCNNFTCINEQIPPPLIT